MPGHSISATDSACIYLDEFRKCGHLGHCAAVFLFDEMGRFFPKYRYKLTTINPDLDSCEAAAGAFYEDCAPVIERAMDGFANDDAFERYVRKTMSKWFNQLYDRTPEGKINDVLRKKLKRDSRFINKTIAKTACWGLRRIGDMGISAASEQQLCAAASQFEVKVTIPNADKPVSRIRYGSRGGAEVENMMEGVLRVANGFVPQPVLLRVFMSRLPQSVLPLHRSTSLDAEQSLPLVNSISAPDETSAQEAATIERLLDDIDRHRAGKDFRQWLSRRLSAYGSECELDVQPILDRIAEGDSISCAHDMPAGSEKE